MILTAHLLLGAGIGSAVSNISLAIILAFMSHYLLDFFPHIEYPIQSIEKRQWLKIMPEVFKIVLDCLAGLLIILIFSSNTPAIYICALFSALPDAFSVLYHIKPNPNKILELHYKLHQKIHFLKHKKISNFWRVLTQIAAMVLSIALLRA